MSHSGAACHDRDPIVRNATNSCTDGHVENIALSFPAQRNSPYAACPYRYYGNLERIFKSVLMFEILQGGFGVEVMEQNEWVQISGRTDSDGCVFGETNQQTAE